MIALSTAWSPRRGASLPDTLRAIRGLGYEAVEIGVSGQRLRLKKALKALRELDLQVVSVHNVCSARRVPQGNERGDWLGSPDPRERQQGVAATRETLAHAEALGAEAVVLHVGSPPIEQRWEKRELLARLTAGGARAEEELGLSREDLLAERDALAPACFQAACQSLEELLAQDSEVKLGIECRVGYHEVPNIEEMAALLDRFPDPRVGYWHDTGHAAIQEAMGLAGQLDWLRRFRERTLGIHLHDVVRGERLVDHYPPGLGRLDFAAVAAHLPPGALRVVEVSGQFLAEEVAMAKDALERDGL